MLELAVIVDTGPLVAYLGDGEPRHDWAVEKFKTLPPPFNTCEPVLTEAFFLLSRVPAGTERLLHLLSSGLLVVDFAIMTELPELEQLMKKYRNVPISLADACLVRLAEKLPSGAVFTLDRHFTIYRKHGRQVIPTIMP